MNIDIASLEQATLDAVAPAEVGALPDWLMPFDSSTVGRATSAVPLRHQGITSAALASIEALYAGRGLKAQFRIADVAGLANLHHGLRDLGYTPTKPTLTMVGEAGRWPATTLGLKVQLSKTPTEAWQSVYHSSDFDPLDGANRVRALSRSQCLVYASLSDASGVVAAGTAAFSKGWASLHGMRTMARGRGQGFATAIIAALGQEALARSIDRCFLQVEEGNLPALHLYRGLGFQSAWLYHYWRKAG
jgi:GNAT superfamily N-acetyltransferase